jgi:hypothetical protein
MTFLFQFITIHQHSSIWSSWLSWLYCIFQILKIKYLIFEFHDILFELEINLMKLIWLMSLFDEFKFIFNIASIFKASIKFVDDWYHFKLNENHCILDNRSKILYLECSKSNLFLQFNQLEEKLKSGSFEGSIYCSRKTEI